MGACRLWDFPLDELYTIPLKPYYVLAHLWYVLDVVNEKLLLL
jgi:hypothetical protein